MEVDDTSDCLTFVVYDVFVFHVGEFYKGYVKHAKSRALYAWILPKNLMGTIDYFIMRPLSVLVDAVQDFQCLVNILGGVIEMR